MTVGGKYFWLKELEDIDRIKLHKQLMLLDPLFKIPVLLQLILIELLIKKGQQFSNNLCF